MEFDHSRFLHAVSERTGLDAERAASAVTHTFEALGRALGPDAVEGVASLVPAELAGDVRRGGATASAGSFLADLAAHEQVSLGFAKEHAQAILEQLANLHDGPTRELLRSRLRARAPEAADWLVPWSPPDQRPPHARTPVDDRSLAGGRPGSRNPVSESAPDPGQHGSPAMTTDPHADTRLSSTTGISTEREASTIAEGRPGSSHPLSEEPE